MKKECVFDGSTDNLNTSMKIKLDSGKEVEVSVCDHCAEDATLRTIKAAYEEGHAEEIAKEKEIAALMARAKELGLDLSPKGQAPAPAPVKSPVKSPAATPLKSKVDLSKLKGKLVDSREADNQTMSPSITNGGGQSPYGGASGAVGSAYSINSESKPSEDLREGELAEVAVVEGRAGVPIRIPVTRVGKMGTTNISIKQTMTDQQLQARFKNMARSSEADQGPSFKDGYEVRFVQCSLCRGNGVVRGKSCPKCNGSGEIQIQ